MDVCNFDTPNEPIGEQALATVLQFLSRNRRKIARYRHRADYRRSPFPCVGLLVVRADSLRL